MSAANYGRFESRCLQLISAVCRLRDRVKEVSKEPSQEGLEAIAELVEEVGNTHEKIKGTLMLIAKELADPDAETIVLDADESEDGFSI
jgi:uncharacterized protein YpuA (DUF1002 family)